VLDILVTVSVQHYPSSRPKSNLTVLRSFPLPVFSGYLILSGRNIVRLLYGTNRRYNQAIIFNGKYQVILRMQISKCDYGTSDFSPISR